MTLQRTSHALVWLTATALAVAVPVLASAQVVPVAGHRLSLSDRVTRLEQAQAGEGGVGLVNQVQTLRSEVQQLQGQVEQLQHQLQQMREQNKAKYIDLDSRLGRLEGRPPGAGSASADSSGDSTQLGDVVLGGAPAASTLEPAMPAPDTSDVPAAAAPPRAPVDDAQLAQADYDNAFAALRRGAYPTAARRFQAFIQHYPQSSLMPNAYYWLGESYYGTQNFPLALRTFQQLVQLYPDSAKARDGLLKVGYSQYELQQWDAARTTLQRVMQRYPNTSDARLAQDRLRALDVQTAAQ